MAFHLQQGPFRGQALLGESSGTYYTVVEGQPCFLGADADGNAGRLIPVTDASAHKPTCLSMVDTADVSYNNGVASYVEFPCTILTDNVASGAEPTATADNELFINDSGEFSNADGGSSGWRFGHCEHVYTSGKYNGLYRLHVTPADEVDTDT